MSKLFTPIALIFSSLQFISPAQADTVRGVGNVWCPWMMEDDAKNAIGAGVDIFKELAKRSGYDVTVNIYPQVRRDKMFETNELDAEVGVSEEWRGYQKDISVYTVPFFETVNVVLVRAPDGITTESVDSFKGKTIGGNIGYFYTDGFQQAFEKGTIKRKDVSEGGALMKMLVSKRVDGIIMDRYESRYWMKKLNLNPKDYKEGFVFKTVTKLSMRFHKNKKELLPKFNSGIEEMKKSGEILKIIDKYTK
jgi:polar amino acid transport system substrate-binding protein